MSDLQLDLPELYVLPRGGAKSANTAEVHGGQSLPTGTSPHVDRKLYWPVRAMANTIETRPVFIQNMTAPQVVPKLIRNAVNDVLDRGRHESLEYGVESQLEQDLAALLHRFGSSAMEVIKQLITQARFDDTLIAATLYSLGRIDHSTSLSDRLRLLEWGLFSGSLNIRKGAVLGLANLDNPTAISSLQAALEHEGVVWLRRYFHQVIDQLQNTAR